MAKKVKAIIVDGKLFKHGDLIYGKWGRKDSEPCMLHIESATRCFALQNRHDGSAPTGFGKSAVNKGYKCSWVFIPGDKWDDFNLDTIKSGIAITGDPAKCKLKTEAKFEMRGSNARVHISKRMVFEDGQVDPLLKDLDVVYDSRVKKGAREITDETHTLFSTSSHPDCCGARIFYNFSAAKRSDSTYQPYQHLTEDMIKQLKKEAGLGSGASKIAHLADYQHYAIEFVEKIGFKKIHSFVNRNSGNTVSIYQHD